MPHRRWPSADYEFLNKVFDHRECISGINEKILEKIVTKHLEQFGRAVGRLITGAEEYALDGLGERDHS